MSGRTVLPGYSLLGYQHYGVIIMKRPIFSSIGACSTAFGLFLFCGNTQAAPLTLTAIVIVKTQVRNSNTPPTVITLARNEVFILRSLSVRASDSLQVTFEKSGDSFSFSLPPLPGPTIDLVGAAEFPLKGPATVTISGKGLVSYEIQTL
jgi:hypothetical protein